MEKLCIGAAGCSAPWRLRRGFSSDESGTHTNLQYRIGAVDGTRSLPMRTDKTAWCCRFCIPVETGAGKVKLRTMAVHTDSHVVAEKMSPGHSGFDFQQTDSVQRIDR